MNKYIRLLDGRVLSGPTWENVEEQFSALFMNQTVERSKFRDDVATRAKLWSGVEIATYGSSDDFFFECERAGMIDARSDSPLRSIRKRGYEKTPLARVVFLQAKEALALAKRKTPEVCR